MQRKHYSSCLSRKLILFPFSRFSDSPFSSLQSQTLLRTSPGNLYLPQFTRTSNSEAQEEKCYLPVSWLQAPFPLFHAVLCIVVGQKSDNCISKIPLPNGFQLLSTNWRHWWEIRRHEEGNNILCASPVQQRWQWWQTSLDSRHPAQAVGIPVTEHLQTLVPVATMTAVDKFRLNFLQRNPGCCPNNTSMECFGNGVGIVDAE